ncbi:sigma-70 family RNA polymerase sigma factor [Solirubrobacter phytolaccae]|uniref:Sigma-70 family RNA polymerase sigma factor n=1 Tax=Solirubrobacter phytolaccae TaxID=1404360 RepID=A0A9X3ND76_9ACTN|nr:sigma-70 family RNA polymerase sigma factor [Solirubrobacter phytolaccae]MDA0180222.1 sigma-70 family RNA polymerase sigma factor [Solirubrobacter phytolaccae]
MPDATESSPGTTSVPAAGGAAPAVLRDADDERLAALVAAGSEDAFDVLVRRHEARLLIVSRRVLRSDDDARDAVQNALIKAFGALRSGQLRGAPRPWLSRIAHHEACSLARVRREFAPLDVDALGGGGDPHDAVVVKERLATLVADVAALPDRLRAPLLLRAETGLTYDEIGRSLGIAPGAARQAVFDARAALTAAADAREADCASIRLILAGPDLRRARSRRVRGHLKACVACRAYRPISRTRLAFAPVSGVAWNVMTWVNGLFTTSAPTAGAAFRSTAVVAVVAGGSLSVPGVERHEEFGRAAAAKAAAHTPTPTPKPRPTATPTPAATATAATPPRTPTATATPDGNAATAARRTPRAGPEPRERDEAEFESRGDRPARTETQPDSRGERPARTGAEPEVRLDRAPQTEPEPGTERSAREPRYTLRDEPGEVPSGRAPLDDRGGGDLDHPGPRREASHG